MNGGRRVRRQLRYPFPATQRGLKIPRLRPMDSKEYEAP